MTVQKTIEQLPCPLTPEESHYKSKQLCQLAMDRQKLEDQKKLNAAEIKAQIEAKDGLIKSLVKEVHEGKELRPIECIEKPRYGDNMVDVIRLDTGEPVYSRPMHPSERQTALDVGELAPSRPSGGGKRKKQIEEDEGVH